MYGEATISNCGVIAARPDYLEGLRQLVGEHEAIFIFDGTITGLRIALRGAQE